MNVDRNSLLIDYIDGVLNEEDRQMVEVELQNSDSFKKEYLELKKLLEQTDNLPLQMPGNSLKTRFQNLLEEETQKEKKSPNNILKMLSLRKEEWMLAAAVALLIVGLGFGKLWQSNQMQQARINDLEARMKSTQQMLMLSMLQTSSASDRINALNVVQASLVDTKDRSGQDKIIEALFYTMNFDDNINVRMKAAESLAQFAKEKEVVAMLVESLKVQSSPEIQIILIDILTEVKATEATQEFQSLIEQDSTHEVVKQKAAYGIEILL